jgi:hypothetical protein
MCGEKETRAHLRKEERSLGSTVCPANKVLLDLGFFKPSHTMKVVY